MAADALTFKIGADTSEFNRKMREANEAARKAAESALKSSIGFSKLGAAMAAVTVASGAFAATMAVAVKAIEKFGNIQDISERTGLSPEFLQKVTKAAEGTGSSIESVGRSVNKFAKELYNADDGGAFASTVSDIGLSIDELRSLNPEELFVTVAKAIAAIENPTRRAAVAQNLLGKSGAELIGVLNGIGNSLNATGFLAESQVEEIDAVGDAWTDLKNEAITAMGAMVAAVSPIIQGIIQELREWVATIQSVFVFMEKLGEGASFGEATEAMNDFANRRFGEIARSMYGDGSEAAPDAPVDEEAGGSGAPSGGRTSSRAPTSSDLGKTPEEKALEKYDADPANRNADGTFRNPGTRRQMQRQSDASRRRADQRNNRIGGEAPSTRGNGSAQIEAYGEGFYSDEITPDASDPFAASNAATDLAQQRGFFDKDPNKLAEREKQIQDAMNASGKTPEERATESRGGTGGGGDSNSLLSEIKSLLSEVRSTVAKIEPKLPQRVLA